MPTLHWIGKEKVINHHLDVPFRVLKHQYTFDNGTQKASPTGSDRRTGGLEGVTNKIIHGDNLEALKALLPEYEGKIKCIYIDPPYNTGNEGWAYNDNVNDPKFKKWLHSVVGKEGEDLSRHDKWLCMMYPRLKLLYKLLADDGAIFVSIDDNEQANLKLILDEIFGGRNFVANIVWQKRTSPDARRKISAGHEYIIIYIKNANFGDSVFNLLELNDIDKGKYKNPDNDPRGPWVSTDCTAQAGHGTKSQFYTLTTPAGRVIELPDSLCWRFTQQRMNEEIEEGRIWFGKDGKGVPRKKTYLSEREGRNLWSWWPNTEVGHTQEATKEITKIFEKTAAFDYPKPLRLLERIIQIATKPDGIILDSFAGSGTTAHAVLNLNKKDGGHRKFILIEMEDYAETITAERVKRVINGYGQTSPPPQEGNNGTGGVFDYYELGEPLFLEEGVLNEAVAEEEIRRYVYYTETQTSLPEKGESHDNVHFLGHYQDTSYYFFYEKDTVTSLDHAFLATMRTKAEQYVIYADNCLLTREFMVKHHLIFKKIPRDITRF
jgi:adenine-specific DNA-methyltransferase